jgi:DNA-binding winged helix-turn-helix (wHTH) protein/tetratricopeptide (TPR) repeat protein
MIDDPKTSYEFDSFRLIPGERQLLRDGQPVSLPPKAFDTLVVLVQHSGHALKKDDLLKQVWPDSFVEESNLNHNISVLRKALSDGNGNSYVETVRGYGFRFNADVRTITPENSAVVVHRRTRTQVVYKEEQAESQRTRTVVEAPRTERRAYVTAAIILLLVIGAASVTYFGFIRPAQSRSSMTGRPPAAAPAHTKPGENPAAREAYLKGRYFWNKRNRDDIFKAQRFFQDALDIDPNYAPAYVGLADCLLMGGAVPGSETSKALALKALAIDDTLAEAHATLAYYMSAVEWDWHGAEVEFQKAISLDPSYATARHWHAYNLASLGRVEEAESETKRAEEADPVSLIIKTDVGHMLYFSRRYEEAINQYLRALQLDPDFRVAHWRLGEAYIQVRRYDEAVIHLQKAINLEGANISGMEAWIAHAKAAANDRAGALKLLNRLKPEAELRRWCYHMALIYAGLGDKDSAFAWLNKSLAYREGMLAVIKVEPMFGNLRDDPRFANLLERMKLPPS